MTEPSTQNTERGTRKIESRRVEIRITRKREIPVKVPELPPADDRVRRKVRTHIICVCIGGFLAILITYISGGLIAHWAPFLPTIPNVVYEILDRIADR